LRLGVWGAAVLRPYEYRSGYRTVAGGLIWVVLELNPAIWEAIAGTVRR